MSSKNCALQAKSRGVGTEFLKAIEGEVKKDGMKQFYLCTEKNVPAFQLQKRAPEDSGHP